MEPSTKKLCTQNLNAKSIPEEDGNLFESFGEFEIKRILNNSEDKCNVAVEGSFGKSSEKAVVVLQKLPFNKETLDGTFSKITNLKTIFKNDVYYNQTAHLPSELNDIKVSTIYPAEEKHIKKFERETASFINETPKLYETITLPFIKSSSKNQQWVYNILEHKKEADRIVCEDSDPQSGFIMVPDLKWTGEQMENLYLQAIVMRRDVLSVRDLTDEHLPLLKNVYEKGTKAIKEKYGVPASKLRVYLHYQPTYYHLHLHFCALSFDAPGIWVGKAHLLQDVISNIETDSEFYKKANISFTIKDNHPLRILYQNEGYFTED